MSLSFLESISCLITQSSEVEFLIQKMPPYLHKICILYYYHNLSVNKIASILRISVNAVYSQLEKAGELSAKNNSRFAGNCK